jgi:hypothetical protein
MQGCASDRVLRCLTGRNYFLPRSSCAYFRSSPVRPQSRRLPSRRDLVTPTDPAALATARRELTAAKLQRSIREALLADPPLTLDQRHDLAALLRDTSKLPVHVTIDGESGLVCRCCGIPLRCQGQEDEA